VTGTLTPDARRTLELLLTINQQEATLIETRDADGLVDLVRRRAPLLTALPQTVDPSLAPLVARVRDAGDANAKAARARAAQIRAELAQLARGQAALTAYAPPRRASSMTREV
jgi:hypothetical protein